MAASDIPPQIPQIPQPAGSVGNMDAGAPLLALGALGVVLGLVYPACTTEGSVGAIMVIVAIQLAIHDLLVRRRQKTEKPP